MRILFVGELQPYLTTAARLRAMRELGHEVETLDQRPFVNAPNRYLRAWTYRTLIAPGVFALNRELLSRLQRFDPDVVWIEKGTYFFPRTLRALRGRSPGLLVYHNTDDWKIAAPVQRLHWRHLLRGLSLYDVHVTSNLHNVEELKAAGYPHVFHMELAANPEIQDPGRLDEDERKARGGPIGFIGHWEPVTERRILHLLRGKLRVRVYGGGWEHARARRELESIVHPPVWGQDYARAIVSFDVNLGIVSKWNRNHTASRTFQIPALGAFLMHERNELVTSYFREGEEAAFFDSDDELLAKCRHYLEHEEERRGVAAAGRRRCTESGYFELDRVRELMPALEDLAARRARERAAGP